MQFTAIRLSALAFASAIVFGVAGPGISAAQAQTAAQADKPIVLKQFTKSSAKKKRVRAARAETSSKSDKANTETRSDAANAHKSGDGAAGTAALAAGAAGVAGAAGLSAADAAHTSGDNPVTSPADMASEIHQRMIGTTASTTEPDASHGAPAADVVAADEVNDLDRAVAAAPAQPLSLANVTLESDAGSGSVVTNGESTGWDKTSLIGRIFIAIGGFLTVASAARMFFV